MPPTNKKIAEEFSNGNFQFAYNYLAEDMQWNIVGDKIINGKEGVIEFCDKTAQYFSAITTSFIMCNLIDGDDCLAIDGTATFTGKDNKSTRISSCDVYRFKDGKLQAVTSYCIVTGKD